MAGGYAGLWTEVEAVLRLSQGSMEELHYDRNSATFHHMAIETIENSGQWSTSF